MRDLRFVGFIALSAAILVTIDLGIVYSHEEAPQSSPPSSQQPSKPTRPKGKTPPKIAAHISPPATLNYYRFHVTLDGTLQTDKGTFHLYAADVPGREYTCTYRNGQRWACGLRSYVALVNLIGSALIECKPKNILKPDVIICDHNNIDLSEWMLRKGWAHLHDGVTEKRYVQAAKAAATAKIGMWTEEPQPPQNATAQ